MASNNQQQAQTDIVVLSGNFPNQEQYPHKDLTNKNGWVECPIPTMLGIPLMAKPIRPYPGGYLPDMQLAVFMMVEPVTGYAPARWQLGPRLNLGMIGFGRRDGKPFTIQQWSDLHSFVYYLMDLYGDERNGQEIIETKITRHYYLKYLRNIQSPSSGQQEQPVYMCARCGLKASKRCTKCHFMYYCNRECQLAHWREEHKTVCCNFKLGGDPSILAEVDQLMEQYSL